MLAMMLAAMGRVAALHTCIAVFATKMLLLLFSGWAKKISCIWHIGMDGLGLALAWNEALSVCWKVGGGGGWRRWSG